MTTGTGLVPRGGVARMPVAWARGVAGWRLWSLPPPLLLGVLAVELTAVVLLVPGLAAAPQPAVAGRLLVLVAAAVCHAEITRGVERTRRRIVGHFHVNLASVWFLAAAVVLPPSWAGLCAGVVHVHQYRRSLGPRSVPHRQLFSTAVTVLSAVAASAVAGWLEDLPAPLPAAAAILVFFTVNTALVAGAIATSDARAGLSAIAGDAEENLLEIATLCLGGIVGGAVLVQPALVLLALPPLLVLHRAVLVRHLERAASTDPKTGLLNAAAWHTRSGRTLRSRRLHVAGLLVLDLDHFKDVNDSYGHLVGDDVLSAVAGVLRAGTHDHDVVGRFGGEEFVVLVAGAGGPDAVLTAADRLRRQIAGLTVAVDTPDGPLTIAGLSVSIGAVARAATVLPRSGDDAAGEVQALLHAADIALYAAKQAGRNRVRIGGAPGQAPHPPARVEASAFLTHSAQERRGG